MRKTFMRQMALGGASHRLNVLNDEIGERERERTRILNAFPELGTPAAPAAPVTLKPVRAVAHDRPRRRRRMSAAARKAASERMRAYWASEAGAKRRDRK